MFRRKPLPGNTSVVPPSPTSPPPPPPGPVSPPQHLVQSLNNRTIINSTQEWNTVNNDNDDDDTDWWDRSDDEEEAQQTKHDASIHVGRTHDAGHSKQSSPIPGSQSPRSAQRPPIPSGGLQDLGDLGVGALSVGGAPLSKSPGTPQTNPFLRKQSHDVTGHDIENVSAIWAEQRMQSQPPQQSSTAPRAVTRLLTGAQPAPPSLAQPDLISFESDPTPQLRQTSWRKNFQFDSEKEAVVPENKIPVINTDPVNEQQAMRRENTLQLNVSPSQPVTRTEVETPRAAARKQRNESYQIKHIRWYDANFRENPRASPILIQNANGPCPLMALVNALVLSTPPTLITPLLETLRTRENISLGLLLDAVFDELMSERRAGGGAVLPDVGELYSFLVTLHTGMNVNPRFVPDPKSRDVEFRGGVFEQTREMRLYSTFGIPLIHGWLPEATDEAYAAFEKLAPTYEDAQNMAFREAEFEHKLQSENRLSEEEESLYIDLTSLKEFLTFWPTQLTNYGLEAIRQALKPGEVSILFRNDHFSTLYKEPRTGQLMTLVTDAGYATHDEIVWESLVDINGSRNELFSGDFRSVSHNPSSPSAQQPLDVMGGDWTTVESKSGRKGRAAGKAPMHDSSSSAAGPGISESSLQHPGPPVPATSSNLQAASEQNPQLPPRPRTHSEREDHDLALALQLQEEEEQAQRASTAARRREDELSERFLSQESSRQGPQIPPRRSNTGTPRGTQASAASSPAVTAVASAPQQPARPAAPQHHDDELDLDGDGEAPPTYEAATAAAKANTLHLPSTPTRPSLGRPQDSLYSHNSASHYNSNAHLPGSRIGQGPERRRLSSQQRQLGRGGAHGGARGGGGVGYGGASGARGGYAQGQTASAEDERCSIM